MTEGGTKPGREWPIVVVMGVSGCGKTFVGGKLAEALGGHFLEGDTFHPP
jgi:gluconokinase